MIGAARRGASPEGDWVAALDGLSVLRHRQTPRARRVAAFPWGDVPGRSAGFNRRWRALRRFVVEAARGEHGDPCPSARWWGGDMDKPRGRMVPAKCAAPMANTFYAMGEP